MTASSKTQRPSKRAQVCDRMKLHLRLLTVRARTYRLVTLRPHTEVAFSTNYFHETWHILSNQHGARLLGRLLWGLSFQRMPGTVVLIHGQHIQPTPFGAERSDPILLTLADESTTEKQSLASLRRRLPRLGAAQRTLRWHTFGLDLALERVSWQSPDRAVESHENDWMSHRDNRPLWNAEQMFRRGGFVVYSAPPAIMRQRALTISQMDPAHYGMDYYYLADSKLDHWADGEVQIFSDFNERRSAAAEARRAVLREGRTFDSPESLYAVVAARRDQILQQRQASYAKRAPSGGGESKR